METQQREQDPKCVLQPAGARAASRLLSVSLSAGGFLLARLAGRRQEIQGEEEQRGFGLMTANSTI